MLAERKIVTLDTFEQFVDLPENAEKLFELVGGEIVEVPVCWYNSVIASRFIGELYRAVRGDNSGHITGEGAGYAVSGECYVPSAAFISRKRQPELPRVNGYVPNPPDLAIEVIAPEDNERLIGVKIVNYLAAGTVVWAVYPAQKIVEVIVPGQPVKILDINDTLDGGTVLPGFTLAVKTIFEA
jgi:Uma2 family endonuclease